MYIGIKRLLDIFLSFVGLIVLSPIFLVIMIAIRIDSKGPILFKQRRYGKGKKPFVIYKFRTMSVNAPSEMPTRFLKNSDEIITRVGRFLRKTSLDELPQIINILKGEMSIVGPRPVILKEVELISNRDLYGANDILPGLTGWAQINGRDSLGCADKAKLDGYYVENLSFRLDVICFVKTVFKVLGRSDIRDGSFIQKKNLKSENKMDDN